MTVQLGIAYDFSAKDLDDLPGADGAILYFGTPDRPKDANTAQVATLLRRGYQIAGVCESGTGDWKLGRAGGQAMARAFDADVTACGLPGLPGYFCADDTTADARFVDYLRGAGDVLGPARVGAYGFLPALTAAHNAGVASRFWLAGHCPNPMPDWVALYQHNGSQPAAWGPTQATVGGITVDRNTILRPDWGQHPLGAFMALTDQEQRDLYNRIMGFCRQQWYILDPKTGEPIEVSADYPNAIPAVALNTLDGHYVVTQVESVIAQTAALATAVQGVKAGTIDVQAVADQLKTTLGAEVAADLAARLAS